MHVRGIFAAAALLGGVALAVPGPAHAAATDGPLSGTLAIAPGECTAAPTGSYFRMILPTGTAAGPFVSNSDSGCNDKTYTALEPGTDGGLVLGTYQSEPTPAFDGSGNSLADHITKPTKFFGVDFSSSTNARDPQTKAAVAAPSISAAPDGTLSGDLRAFAASWNNQEFNQGAPKPDGSAPGLTAAPTGTLDATSGAYTLEWRSQIVGGPFDRFTGVWHLEGTFTPDATPTTTAVASSDAQSSTDNGGFDSSSLSGGGSAAASSTSLSLASSGPAPSSGAPPISQAAAPTVRSPSVVVARTGGGGSGKGWVLIPIGLGALAAIAIAIRVRTLRRREVPQ